MLRSLDTFESYRPNTEFINYVWHVVSLDTSGFIEITVVFTKDLSELRTTTLICVKGEKMILSEVEFTETSFIAKKCLNNKTMEFFGPPSLLECNILQIFLGLKSSNI